MAVTQTTRKRDKMRGQRGQTMVEFAIVLPIFLLLLLGIAQGGIAFNHYIQLTDATRAGARYGAPLGCSGSCDRSSLVVDEGEGSAANLNQAQVGVTVTSTWQPGTDLHVCATYPFSINLIGLVVSERQPQLVHNGACGMTRKRRHGLRAERGQMLGDHGRLDRGALRHGSVRHGRRLVVQGPPGDAVGRRCVRPRRSAEASRATPARRRRSRTPTRRRTAAASRRSSVLARTRSRTTRSRSGASASRPASSRVCSASPPSTSRPTRRREPGTSARRSTRRPSASTRRTRCSRAAAARASTQPTTLDLNKVGPGAFRIVNIDGSQGGIGQQILATGSRTATAATWASAGTISDPGAKFNPGPIEDAHPGPHRQRAAVPGLRRRPGAGCRLRVPRRRLGRLQAHGLRWARATTRSSSASPREGRLGRHAVGSGDNFFGATVVKLVG